MAKLSGFTLFKVSAGWQLSTRAEGETGWSVRIIPDSAAQVILGRLDDVDHKPQTRPTMVRRAPV
jgi:hypothetical protein